ncbi:MAG: alpha/beta fold hydrolase [Rhodopseudomonas sp.]|nr:alpha/beta fold hydrolase [Rhodopseudomonas sp.]
MTATRRIQTPTLDIAYEEDGPVAGVPVLLMHGWPYDPRVYDAVVPPLVTEGCRVIVPYLRGFGATRFLSDKTPRSGQQAALGHDLKDFMDALALKNAMLVGYDWGGRAACIVAALWPDYVRGLVTGNGYNIQDIPNANKPADPEQEWRYWYQFYFHTERGRAGLTQNRRALVRLLWSLWSPHWAFDDTTFARSAPSWDNPDFVDVTIQSYRHRYGNAPGDPALDEIERRLAAQPAISAPTIVLQGDANGVVPEMWTRYRDKFTGPAEERRLKRVGHNIPAEAPDAVVKAVLDTLAAT